MSTRWVPFIAAAVVVAAACGGSGDGESTEDTAGGTTTAPPASDVAEPESPTPADEPETSDPPAGSDGSDESDVTTTTVSSDEPAGADEPDEMSAAKGTRVGLGAMLDIAVSPDGSQIVGAGYHHVWLVDVPSMESTVVDLGDDSSDSVAFDPTGSSFAVGLESGAIEIWDAAGRELRVRIPDAHDEWANLLAYSGDGRLLASTLQAPVVSTTEPIVVHDVETGEVVVELPEVDEPAKALALDDDGSMLAMMSLERVVAWDVATGEQIYDELIIEDYQGVVDLRFSDDGEILFVLSEGPIQAIDTATWSAPVDFAEPTTEIQSSLRVYDGGLIVEESLGQITRFDANGAVIGETVELVDSGLFGTFIDDIEVGGDFLVALMDENDDLVVVDIATGELIASTAVSAPRVDGSPEAVAFSPDGGRLYLLHDGGTLTVWDVSASPPALIDRRAGASRPGFALDGTLYATIPMTPGEFDDQVVDLTNGGVVVPPDGLRRGFTYDPGTGFAVGYDDDAIVLVDIATDTVVQTIAVDERPDELALTPAATHLVAITDETLRIWDATSGEPVLDETYPDLERALEFADGQVWVIITDETDEEQLTAIDPVTGTASVVVVLERGGAPFAVTADGSTAVVEAGNVLYDVIDVASGDVTGEAGSLSPTVDIAVAPDGRVVALAGVSGTALLVPLPDG